VLAWLSVCSEVQTCIWSIGCHCHSLTLASVKSRLVLPFWYWLTRVVPGKGPLCVCVCVWCVCVWCGVCVCVCVCVVWCGVVLSALSPCLYKPTHTCPFNGPFFSGTPWVSQYQKGKTNLDSTEARDIEWQRHQLGHVLVCTLLQTDNHTSTPPLSFLQARCPSCRPTNSVKSLKADTCIKPSNMYFKSN